MHGFLGNDLHKVSLHFATPEAISPNRINRVKIIFKEPIGIFFPTFIKIIQCLNPCRTALEVFLFYFGVISYDCLPSRCWLSFCGWKWVQCVSWPCIIIYRYFDTKSCEVMNVITIILVHYNLWDCRAIQSTHSSSIAYKLCCFLLRLWRWRL